MRIDAYHDDAMDVEKARNAKVMRGAILLKNISKIKRVSFRDSQERPGALFWLGINRK